MKSLFEIHTIDSGKTGPEVLITAGVHGDEHEPIIAAGKLAHELPAVLQRGRVILVPCVNVSAYNLNSRCGEDGLDLARTCPGSQEGSLTERVAFQVSKLIRQASYFIDLHTGGRIFDIFPLAGYMLHDSPGVLEAQRKMAEAFSLPVIWGTDNRAEGRTLSVARDANVPAIYVEYGGPSPISARIVKEYSEGCLRVLALLDMVKPEEPSGHTFSFWVEDHRLDNGHLQSKTPSPADGIFIPEVEVGSTVQTGDLWGTVQDPVSGVKSIIKADFDGLVLFTRVRGYVKKDESLGGLLPITKPGKIVFNEQ